MILLLCYAFLMARNALIAAQCNLVYRQIVNWYAAQLSAKATPSGTTRGNGEGLPTVQAYPDSRDFRGWIDSGVNLDECYMELCKERDQLRRHKLDPLTKQQAEWWANDNTCELDGCNVKLTRGNQDYCSKAHKQKAYRLRKSAAAAAAL